MKGLIPRMNHTKTEKIANNNSMLLVSLKMGVVYPKVGVV
jgi:hypothetical protein